MPNNTEGVLRMLRTIDRGFSLELLLHNISSFPNSSYINYYNYTTYTEHTSFVISHLMWYVSDAICARQNAQDGDTEKE